MLYTRRISPKAREKAYLCQHCDTVFKSVEEIVQIAKFKPA
ncbi:MAG TPA: hypothetical protein H9889_01865 [Candidatus Ignatzschineria merdigallinarum]|uniref:Uncharacterized protein n=1 Tax=Candidatus Ignatzschineria merdigallinarum TaxID=2838621 RepID=A0A9D1Q4R4_9GAMM|nr:hypothetical protein [Candidatus Ignatzschineria merdigallinarum]